MDPDVEDLQRRVAELERRIDVIFRSTGALDLEKAARDAPEASAEVQSLLARGEEKKAAKLYMKETGADMHATMAALGKLKGVN